MKILIPVYNTYICLYITLRSKHIPFIFVSKDTINVYNNCVQIFTDCSVSDFSNNDLLLLDEIINVINGLNANKVLNYNVYVQVI